jgi:hypothetical protein
MHLHVCVLDAECRKYGAPNRVYIHTRRGVLTVAFSAGSRMARLGRRSQWVTYDRRSLLMRRRHPAP